MRNKSVQTSESIPGRRADVNGGLLRKRPGRSLMSMAVLSAVCMMLLNCETPANLRIAGNDRPTFEMSGGGTLGYLRVHGPHKQREIVGEAAVVYWEIEPQAG